MDSNDAKPSVKAVVAQSLNFERFFTMSLDMLCTATVDTGYFVALNEAWTKTLGFTADELRAAPFLSFVHPDDQAATIKAAGQLAQGENVIHFKNRYRCKDGSWKWLEWSSSVSMEEGLIYAVARDVDESTLLTARIAEQASLLDTIAAGAPIVLSVFDRGGIFLKHVGAALGKLSLKPNQLVGQSVFDAFAGADEALELIRAALNEGREMRNIQEIGDTIWANWIGPLRDTNGDIAGAIAVSTDITDREQARKDLEERLQFIETQNKAIREMAAPILEVWEGVVVLTVMGHVDAVRASLMQESLLHAVVEKRARFAVIDLTAVDEVDVETAQHLLRLSRALRLLGTQAIISGIQARVAQALHAHGGEFSEVETVASLYSALRRCMGSAQRR